MRLLTDNWILTLSFVYLRLYALLLTVKPPCSALSLKESKVTRDGHTDVASVLTCSGECALPKHCAPLVPTTSRCWTRRTVRMVHWSHPWQVTPFFSNKWVSSSPAFLRSTQLCVQPPKSCPRVQRIIGCYRCVCMCIYTHTRLNSCFAHLLLEIPRHSFFCSFARSHINFLSCSNGLHI